MKYIILMYESQRGYDAMAGKGAAGSGRAYLATNRCSLAPDRGEGTVLERVTVSCRRLLTAALPTVYRRGSTSPS